MSATKITKLSRSMYRDYALLAKQHAGSALQVSTYSAMNCWGAIDPMARGIYKDAKDVSSHATEGSVIKIADRINVNRFQSAMRPELDWSAIPGKMVYEFVLWHEIGHIINNLCSFDLLQAKGLKEPLPIILRKLGWVNETLADRFAWNTLFPKKKLPLNPKLPKERPQMINSWIDELSKVVEVKKRKPGEVPTGQYQYVPFDMLKSTHLAAYVGPEAIVRH